jgi:hypothetical protein
MGAVANKECYKSKAGGRIAKRSDVDTAESGEKKLGGMNKMQSPRHLISHQKNANTNESGTHQQFSS